VEGTVNGLMMDYVERTRRSRRSSWSSPRVRAGSFPKDTIGLVETVGEVDVNIYKLIEVRPFVDFRSLGRSW